MSQLDSILILYSSQTGTGKSIAELFVSDDLPSICTTTPRIYDFTAYMKIDPDLSLLNKETNPILFIISTTGQGDFPDNALPFMRIIRRMDKKYTNDTPRDELPLKNVQMVNLGLGDSNYDRFNGGIQQIEKYLIKLGATKLLPTIHADDGIGLELGVEKWRTGTITFLKNWSPNSNNNNNNTDTTTTTPATTVEDTTTPTTTITTNNDNITKPEEITTTTTTTTTNTEITTDKSNTTSSLLPTPTLYVSPPIGTNKPQFLLKQHQPKVTSFIVPQNEMNNAIQTHFTKKKTANNTSPTPIITTTPLYDITQIKQSSHLSSMYIYETKHNDITTTLYGDQLLLQQYIASHNLHTFLLDINNNTTNNNTIITQQRTQLLNKLSELEYGYSNINTLPLFANLTTITLPSQTTNDFPEIKTTIDMSLSLPLTTTQVLSSIPVSSTNNPTVTIETFPTSTTSQNQIEIRSLYRPGDSVSILCPNTYNSVQSILNTTGLNEYSQYNLLLHSIPSTTIKETIPTESATTTIESPTTATIPTTTKIETPLTHLHCQQPSSDLINDIFYPQSSSLPSPSSSSSGTTTSSTIESKLIIDNIISIGNVLLDIQNGSIISIVPTLESLLTHSIELTAPIKKSLVRSFAEMCKSFSSSSSSTPTTITKDQQLQQPESDSTITPINDNNTTNLLPIQQYQICVVELLYQLMSKDGRSKIKQYIEEQSITVLDLLEMFSYDNNINVIQPDINILIELCNSLKPRSYSISSSPYQHMILLQDQIDLIHLNNNNDVEKLYNMISTTTTSPKQCIAGTSFRFAATLTVDTLPLLQSIPKADYPTSHDLPSNCTSITSQTYIDKQNSNNNNTSTPIRNYNGLCTNWFVQLYYDYNDLLLTNYTTINDIITFLSTKSQYHNNPRFWGCIVQIQNNNTNTTKPIITISLPFFFHTSPTFHPPTLLTTTTTTPNPTISSPLKSSSDNNNNNTNTNTNNIQLPNKMLLFGPGTGASPFLSFIEHKFYSSILLQLLQCKNKEELLSLIPKQFQIKTINELNYDDNNSINEYYNNNINITIPSKSILTINSINQPNDNNNININQQYGEITLFSGNRYRNKDYLYGKHWLDHIATNGNSLNTLHSIFSREDINNIPQTRYVQDLIQIYGKEICQHILSGGFIYVCGDGVIMSKQVQKSIENVIALYCQEFATLYNTNYDIIINDNMNQQEHSNSNPTSYTTRFNNETISFQLIDYVTKNPNTFQTQFERETWARGIVAVMMKSGRYNTDVW